MQLECVTRSEHDEKSVYNNYIIGRSNLKLCDGSMPETRYEQ